MFETAAQMWKYARPRLAGRWTRAEVVFPDGFPDWYGFVNGRVQFIEAKAKGDRVRLSQRLWLGEAWTAGIGAHILKAEGSRLVWYRDAGCRIEVPSPPFWRTMPLAK